MGAVHPVHSSDYGRFFAVVLGNIGGLYLSHGWDPYRCDYFGFGHKETLNTDSKSICFCKSQCGLFKCVKLAACNF